MTCSAEFPCYSSIDDAIEQAVARSSTVPAAPPDDPGQLHPMTWLDAMQTISVLREQLIESRAETRKLETELAQLRAERR